MFSSVIDSWGHVENFAVYGEVVEVALCADQTSAIKCFIDPSIDLCCTVYFATQLNAGGREGNGETKKPNNEKQPVDHKKFSLFTRTRPN
ncbi:hypothetical protein RRG08_064193 [Elysia crispata]|uniref:Uncharacterized protein n=1 Tax=Elysia crispata TaxID=231223 RepID=A0AAE0ZYL4_9GAST|nr:hypothetical protein RRG08_064193 [Elysia crispata]